MKWWQQELTMKLAKEPIVPDYNYIFQERKALASRTTSTNVNGNYVQFADEGSFNLISAKC